MLMVDDATVVAPDGRKYFVRIEQRGFGSDLIGEPGGLVDMFLGIVAAAVAATVGRLLMRRSARRIVVASQFGYTGEHRRWKEWVPDEEAARERFSILVDAIATGGWTPESARPPSRM